MEMDDAPEEIGLYDDLHDVDLGDLVSKLENDKEILSKQIKSLEADVERLVSELTCMKETEKSLSRNISELYKTAKTEIERKDRMINSLRAERDNLVFRRTNRATEERQINDYANAKRIKQEVVDDNPSKRRKCENEPHARNESGRHSPRRRGSSDSRDYKDRHSSYNRDNHRHKDSVGGSSRRNRENDSNDKNRSRYHTKVEDSEHKNESSSDKNKYKHNSVTKQDLTKRKERDRNENTGDFKKRDSESASLERKRKYDSHQKSSTENENDRSKVSGPSDTNTPLSNTKNPAEDSSSKPKNCDNSSHLKNVPKVEDKSNIDKKKNQSLKPFSFFDKTLSPIKDKILPSLPRAMECEVQLNSKTVIEPKGDKINSTDETKKQNILPKSSSIQEEENLISPRHDNLMNYLEIKPKKETNPGLSKDEKLVSVDCEKKLKSKTSTKEKSGFSKEEKGKTKIERKPNATTSKASNVRSRSEKENKSESNQTKTSKNYDKSSTRKHESKEKRKRRVNVISESGSEEQEDPVQLKILCKERERIKRDLEQLSDSEEDDHSGEETSSLDTDDAKVTFLANVHISPVIKAKKGATNRLQECIEKLGVRESNANNVVTSNENLEQDNKIVPTKNENSMEVTSSYADDSIGSPTSSSNQIVSKRTPRLANLIDKLSGKEPNCSRYDVFAESVNEIAHSTLKINDCQLSSSNTTIMEETAFAQPGTSAMNNSKVLPKLISLKDEIIANQPGKSDIVTVKPQLPSLEPTNNSAGVNLVRSLETSNPITMASNTTNNNSTALEKSKTGSIDPNISSSSEHLNNSNSTILLNSSLSLNNSSENSSSVRTVFNNRRRRCVVKIVN